MLSRQALRFSRSICTFHTRFQESAFEVNPKALSHTPVMLSEVISYLNPQPGQTVLDMTFGSGGHSEAILQSTPDIKVIGLDRDPLALKFGKTLENKYPNQFIPILGRFSESASLLKSLNISNVDSILFDLGCSSMQFDDSKRGFSLSQNGPLDMRMDGDRFPDQPTAGEILQFIEEEDLVKILKVYGEEKQAKKIARAVIEARYMFKSLNTTSELASLVRSVLEDEVRLDKLGRPTHVATKTFQALRIFVNNELNELNHGMELAYELLKPFGTLVALTFHSLEDRIVKRHMVGIDMDEPVTKKLSQKYHNSAKYYSAEEVDGIFNKKWSLVTKHVHVPTFSEVKQNPRSRSVKLRCAYKN